MWNLAFIGWLAVAFLAGLLAMRLIEWIKWKALRRGFSELLQSQNNFIVSLDEHNRRQRQLISDEQELNASWKRLNETMEQSNAAAKEVLEARRQLGEDLKVLRDGQKEIAARRLTYEQLYKIAQAARDHCRGDEDGARLAKMLDETGDAGLMYTR